MIFSILFLKIFLKSSQDIIYSQINFFLTAPMNHLSIFDFQIPIKYKTSSDLNISILKILK